MSARPASLRPLDLAALLCAAAGLAVAAWAAGGTPARMRTLGRRAEDLTALQQLRVEAARYDPARRVLSALPARRAEAVPAAVFHGLAPEAPAPRVSVAAPQPAGEGWAVRRHELVFPEIGLDLVGRLVTACETSRPPWRLVEARVSALGAVGRGSATLVFEGVEPASPAAPGAASVPAVPPTRSAGGIEP